MKSTYLIITLFAGFLCTSGCVEREEKINVLDDGSVTMSIKFTADSRDELYEGRVPSIASGWTVHESTDQTVDGKTKYILTANKSYTEGSILPHEYTPSNQSNKNFYLQFPTSLTIDQRGEDTYFHFKRTYQGRPWAYINRLKDNVGNGRIDQLLKEDPKLLSHPDRIDLIRFMARVEALKKLEFARSAVNEIHPCSQIEWLVVYDSVLKQLDRLDYSKVAHLLSKGDETTQNELQAEAESFEKKLLKCMISGLKSEGGYSDLQLQQFQNRLAWHERFFEVTEDLEGENFEVLIEMPGQIIGSNGEQISQNQIKWEFKGKMLYDSNLEIMASSKLLAD